MINKFTIYGERCSGTNYLETIILRNFDVEITWEYGWKHFFGFQEQDFQPSSNDTLFICIVRDICPYLNSLFRDRHHLPLRYIDNLTNDEQMNMFLNGEFFSVNDAEYDFKTYKSELMTDRNIYTGNRYKNIFELRHTKLKYLIDDLPKKVKNYIFIKYEDLIDDFENTMHKITNKGLQIKPNIVFPLNSLTYKYTSEIFDKNNKKQEYFLKDEILNNPNLIKYYEIKLGYI